jgi:phosphoribosylformylglycinamidine cyclo-ligase
LHSNGYSLARRVLLDAMGLAYDAPLEGVGRTVAEALLEPTLIYARAVSALLEAGGERLHALSHITGGGLADNVPRVLPEGLAARIDLASYARPPLFELLAAGGPIDEEEMRRTFNLGVGLVAVVDAAWAEDAVARLEQEGERAWLLGRVERASQEGAVFVGR